VPWWIDKGARFLWSSERDGQWELELRDKDGALIRTVTPPGVGYRKLIKVTEAGDRALIQASLSPTESHVASISLDSAKQPPRWLTRKAGSHSIRFHPKSGRYLHTAFLESGTNGYTVHDGDGKMLARIRSLAEKPPFKPNLEFTRVGDKVVKEALIIRPWNFKAGQKYPVIVYVYGGPHHRVVSRSPSRYLIQQWLADQGFIVVMADGRGTPYAGRDWERSIKDNLVDLQLEDQVSALQALGARYSELDLSRVGVFGWSFGGYMTSMMVMRRGDIYRAGVAGAPVADWRDYDTHYTERYMGLPSENAAGYKNGSVLTWAKELQHPLLIIHGTVDDNVYFMHAVKMSNALFRAGKTHSLLPLSGSTHAVHDKEGVRRLYERIADFFVRNLMN
jgi:dipeptidyl-peptidase-4